MTSSQESSTFSELDFSPEQLGSKRDELIVAIPYADLVIETIRAESLPVRVVGREYSEDLGLELLTLSFDDTFDNIIKTRVENLVKDKRITIPESPDPTDRIGPLMAVLRHEIGERFGGWSCTMGRNRQLGHITATDGRVISHDDDPNPVGPAKHLPPLEWLRASVGPSARDVVVGIADTALWDHEWYQSADIVRTGPYIYPDPLDAQGEKPYRTGHSTFVTGIVLAQAPSARIRISGVLNANGDGDSWEVAKALVKLGKSGIDILNLSFCQFTSDGKQPLALATAIDRLDPKIVVVAGAGNYGESPRYEPLYPDGPTINVQVAPAWPAALDDVVAVGASSGRTDCPAAFSPKAPWVDILAPGDTVISTCVKELFREGIREPFASWSGTSFSTAVITGTIAARMASTGSSASDAWQAIRSASRPSTCDSPVVHRVVNLADVRPELFGPRTRQSGESNQENSEA